MRRSSETEGSPLSIFATRDWLEPIRWAKSSCVRSFFWRRFRRRSASSSRSSTYAASSSDRPRNSWAFPTLQPFFSSRSFFALRVVILPEAHAACLQDALWRLLGLLGEYSREHYRVRVNAVDDSPSDLLIRDSQFVAAGSQRWHGSRMWKRPSLAPLELSKQLASLHSRRVAEWRSLHLPVQPYERLVFRAH